MIIAFRILLLIIGTISWWTALGVGDEQATPSFLFTTSILLVLCSYFIDFN